VGRYNVSNLLGVLAVARALGVSLADAVQACALLTPVPGRMEQVHARGARLEPLVLVDYAHTPDALEKALLACSRWRAARLALVGGGRLWRRPRSRASARRWLPVAERSADQVVLTSDNPRSEDPLGILAQMRPACAIPSRWWSKSIGLRPSPGRCSPGAGAPTWCWWPAKATRITRRSGRAVRFPIWGEVRAALLQRAGGAAT
jgi:UDP-N-acetylmuramyl tripeptide synthase